MGTSNSDIEPVEVLAEDFMQRQRRGENPSIEEYAKQHPKLADEIREVFPALAIMERATPKSGDAAPAKRVPPLRQLGDYRIMREIGRGGMGVVYEAEQQSLGRRVALKVLTHEFTATPERRRRFEREARAAARMHHTNIVPVFEVGNDGDTAFYAMQLIRGQSLDAVVGEIRDLRGGSPSSPSAQSGRIATSLLSGQFKQESLSEQPFDDDSPDAKADSIEDAASVSSLWKDSKSTSLPGNSDISSADSNRPAYFRSIAQIGIQTAGALAYAHSRGIVHRDIKPANLLLDTTGVVWVTDFGLAKTTGVDLTHTGDIVGTLRYMSPERFGGDCDQRADIYSLGLTLYELLTLNPAFQSSDRAKTIQQVCNSDPVAPRTVDDQIPRDLETIVRKAIDKDPKLRYQTADAILEDLQRFVNDEPIRARPVSGVERLVRWTRRNKPMAALVTTAITLLVLLTVVSMVSAWRSEQQSVIQRELSEKMATAAANAETARQTAESARRAADEAATRSRNQLYASNMQLADQLWNSRMGAPRQLDELLARWIPEQGEEDLRELAWRYQWTRLHNSARSTATNVNAATTSSDGGLITAGVDGILAWNGKDGGVRTIWEEDAGNAVLAPGGKWAAVALASNQLQIVNLLTAKVERFVEGTGVAFSANGQFMVTHDGEQDLEIFDMKTGVTLPWLDEVEFKGLARGEALTRMFRGKQLPVALSPNGMSLMVMASPQHDIISLYQSDRKEPILLLHPSSVVTCTWSNDLKTIASTDVEGRVYLRQHSHPHQVLWMGGDGKAISALHFSPNSKQIAAAGNDGMIDVWDVSDVDFSTAEMTDASSKTAGSRKSEGELGPENAHFLLPISEHRLIQTFKGHFDEIQHVEFSADGHSLASLDTYGTAKLWLVDDSNEAVVISPPVRRVGQLGLTLQAKETGPPVLHTIDPDGPAGLSGEFEVGDQVSQISDSYYGATQLAELGDVDLEGKVFGPAKTDVQLTRLRNGQAAVVRLKRNSQHATRFIDLKYSPDGRFLAAADELSGTEWSVENPASPVRQCEGHCSAVAYSPDGRFLAMSILTKIQIWDRHTDKLHAVWDYGQEASALEFSPSDGQYLAAVPGFSVFSRQQDGSAGIWHVPTSRALETNPVQFEYSTCDLEFTPDGNYLVSATHRGRVVVQRTTDWEIEKELNVKGGAWSISISPNGKQLAVGGSYSGDQGISLWDLDTGGKTNVLAGHTMPVSALAFSPDGRTLISGSGDHSVVIWDLYTNMPLRTLPDHSGWVTGIDFSPDGSTFTTASSDSSIRIWNTASLSEINQDENTLAATYRRGITHNSLNEFKEAEEILTGVLRRQQQTWPDNHVALSRTRNGLADALFGRKKFAEAIKLLNKNVTQMKWFRRRAYAYLCVGDHQHAAEDHLSLGLKRRQIGLDYRFDLFHAAAHFLMSEDANGYLRVCGEVAKDPPSNPNDERVFVKTLLMSPEFLQRNELAFEITKLSRYDGSKRDASIQWSYLSTILYAFRKGRLDETRNLLGDVERLRADGLVADKTYGAFLALDAMVACGEGDQERAKQMLLEAEQAIPPALQHSDDGPILTHLRDAFVSEILRREAVAMLSRK